MTQPPPVLGAHDSATPYFQHTPRGVMQPKTKGVAQHLPVWQHFGEYISSHVIHGAAADVHGPASHDLVDEMKMDVNVLGPHMICNRPGGMVRHRTPISSRTGCVEIVECFMF